MPQLEFRRVGKEDAPAVLLVHGWMMSGCVWDTLADRLPGFRLLIPDLRGAGASPGFTTPVTLEVYLADLRELVSELDVRDCHLVGHSMGGQLASLLAAAEPGRFRTLTLVNPVPIDGLPLPADVQRLFRDAGGRREALGRILDTACLALPPGERERLLDEVVAISPTVIAEGFDAWRTGIPDTNLDSVSSRATVVATDDPFLPPSLLESAVSARLPDARLHHLPGAGHYPQNETPDAMAGLLRSVWQ